MKYLIVLGSFLLWGCGSSQDEAAKPVVAVKVARAEKADMSLSVRAPATVFPRQQANVSARVTAPIRDLRVRKGDNVGDGELLADLDNRDIVAQRDEARASLAAAQANLKKTSAGVLPTDIERARGQLVSAQAALNQAQKVYDRRSDLFRQGAIPGRELLTSETDLAQAKAAYQVAKRSLDLLQTTSRENDVRMAESAVRQAQARLAYAEEQNQFTEIRSPFAGTITEQFVFPGDMAKPDSPLFTVMDLVAVVARAQVPETDADGVRTGQPCTFDSIDGNSPPQNGRVSMVSGAVDTARRTVEVWCEIPNRGRTLRAGTFGNVTIRTGTAPQAVVVPLLAVQFSEGTNTGTVHVVDSAQIAHSVSVVAGERAGDRVQIVHGVKAGDEVIVEGGYGLPDGTQVQVASR